MASDQIGYMEHKSSDDEQNPNTDKIEESDQESEDSSEDEQNENAYNMSEQSHSANNTGIPLAPEENPNIIKNKESDLKLEDHMEDSSKEASPMPEQVISQTLKYYSDSDEDMDVNYVVGASAETLYTLTHTHDTPTGRKRVNYSCNVCEKDFEDKRVCIRHIRVHTGEKPFVCNECGESFGREDYLRSHVKSHKGDKPFPCPICNRFFAHKSTVASHLLTHTDVSERPYPCDQCESAFIKKSHLDRHLKTHAQNFDHFCSVCGKGFLEKRRMLDHMRRLHSERVLPKCERCKREFKWDHLLRRHIKAHIDNPCEEASEEKASLLNMFTNIAADVDNAKIQATNIQNPETSDSHSLFGNVVLNNDDGYQNSDTDKPNYTKEELSILNPQFSNEYSKLVGILEKPHS